jgi:uncharacterized protein (DUF1800 family)
MVKSLRPLRPHLFDYWKAQHLLNRAGFGGSPSQVRALATMGLEGAVDHLVDYQKTEAPPVKEGDFDSAIMTPLTDQERQKLTMARQAGDEVTLEQYRMERQKRQRDDRRQMAQLQAWWLTRLFETPRPLEEKMTLFWHGHFATNYRAIEDSYHMFLQNQLFRHHAVGSFRALAHGIIRDPAMLRYLNNDQNRRRRPNENLARELMELFTLGEGHGYSEQDIKEGARALTGYTFADDKPIDQKSRRYRNLHDDGPKQILGRTGNFDGDDFVEIILNQRACTEFICLKLYKFFVNDLPDDPAPEVQEYVIDLAKLFRGKGFQLKPVLKAMFMSEHFYDPANLAMQIKSPVQLIVQAVRSLQTPTRNHRMLLAAADLMGQSIFFPPSVQGWVGGRAWINTSTLFVRHNLMVYLLTGQNLRFQGGRAKRDRSVYDPAHLVEHLRLPDGSLNLREAVTYLLWFNFGRQPDASRVDALVAAAADRGGKLDNETLVHLLMLVTASPEYQLC